MTTATMRRVGDELVITPRLGLLPELKTLGATWDAGLTAWKLPAAAMHVAAVRDLLPDVEEVGELHSVNLKTFPASTNDRLYPWQREVAGRLAVAPRGQLLVATPGLGKTAMSIVAADMVGADQIVVVAPSPLLRTWEREIKAWCEYDPSTIIVHGGEPDWEDVRRARWIITSWDIVARHQDWFAGKWPLWILDESVLAKSRRSARSMALRGGTRRAKRKSDGTTVAPPKHWDNLRKGIDRVWLLSGSPTTRYADDLWAQFNLIWPRAYPSYWRFANRYCVVEENRWTANGTVIGTRRDRDVMTDNWDMVIVVNQESVLDLPEYLFEAVDVDLTKRQRRAYDAMTRDFVAELEAGGEVVADNRIAQLQKLQQIASYWDGESSKHDALVDLVASGAYEAPHLIWTHWREGADELTKRLLAAGVNVHHVSGDTSPKEKDRLIEEYKGGVVDGLVLSLGVGKFGHTLTNTKTVHYVDKTWSADDYVQSLRRVRRITLTHRPVLVSYRAPGTVDELVELNLEGKSESIARITQSRLRELIMGLGR